jgi:hypothetical protein
LRNPRQSGRGGKGAGLETYLASLADTESKMMSELEVVMNLAAVSIAISCSEPR